MLGRRRLDGGWGWAVVAASFGLCFLCDGIRYSYGLLYVEFLQEFQRGKGETSWIGSIMFGTYNLSGPIASVVIRRFGCRAATILGCAITFTAYIISMFATSLHYLYFSFGILGGFGFVLMMLPFNIMIIEYFQKKRSLAMGIAMCGTGVGTIVFNPLSKFLIDEYQWRGTLLIEAGMLLNGIICGWAMQPLSSDSNEYSTPTDSPVKHSNTSENATSFISIDAQENHSKPLLNSINHVSDQESKALLNTVNDIPDHEEGSKVTFRPNRKNDRSSKDIQEHYFITDEGQQSVVEDIDGHKQSKDHDFKGACEKSDGVSKGVNTKSDKISINDIKADDEELNVGNEINTPDEQFKISNEINTGTADAALLHSYDKLGIVVNDANTGTKSVGDKSEEINSITPDQPLITDNTMTCKSNTKTLKEILMGIYHFELLIDGGFLVFMISVIFIGLSFMVPWTYLPDLALSMGFTRGDAAWILSSIGIANTIFRIPAGVIGDRTWFNRWYVYVASILVSGVSIACMPLVANYYILMTSSVIFGLATGIFVVLFPLVLADIFGEDMFADSFGLILFGSGISVLVGPPLTGWVFDKTGNYLFSFIIAGAEFFLGGAVLFLVPCLKRPAQTSKTD